MKNKSIYSSIFLVVCAMVFSACSKDKSPVVTQTFELETFKGVELSISGNVRIVEGVDQIVEITGNEETVSRIKKTVNNGVWDIDLPNDYRKTYKDLDIVITSNALEELIISGSGKINADHPLPLTNIVISGSGNIEANAATTFFNSTISGSGSITLVGNAEQLDHKTSGSGSLNGYGLESKNCKVNISGSGNAKVNVAQTLDVNITGSGSVYYLGNPSITTNITGSGKVVNADK